jgi:uncharacterized membrane protein
MRFLEWSTLSLHIFSVVVWLGALCYQSAVLFPVTKAEGVANSSLAIHLHRRFLPFIWLCLWSIGITGVLLFVLSSFKVYEEPAPVLTVSTIMKLALFTLIVLISLRVKAVYSMHRILIEKSERPESTDDVETYRKRIESMTRLNIMFGIMALLIAVGRLV